MNNIFKIISIALLLITVPAFAGDAQELPASTDAAVDTAQKKELSGIIKTSLAAGVAVVGVGVASGGDSTTASANKQPAGTQ